MSYGARLVQMTGRATPVARPAVHEVVEAPSQAPPPSEPAARSERTEPARETRGPKAVTETVAAPVKPRREPATQVIQAAPTPAPIRETTHVIERRVVPALPAQPAPTRVPREQRVVHEWLAERPDGKDALDQVDAGDEMRELLRAIRGWTSEPPAVVEHAVPAPADVVEVIDREPERGQTIETPTSTARAEEPMQVSIGNVTITIEDAPAPSGRPRSDTSRAIDVEGRLARHYLRGH